MSNSIQTYYRKLDDLRRIAGADNEGALRSAFQTLLDTLGQELGLDATEYFSSKKFIARIVQLDNIATVKLVIIIQQSPLF